MAATLPSLLKLFKNTSSLGSVESLVDYRHRKAPSKASIIPKDLLRFSIGLESFIDLQADFENAIKRYHQTNNLSRYSSLAKL